MLAFKRERHMDQLSIGKAAASFPFEKDANKFLDITDDTRWAIERDNKTIKAIPDKCNMDVWSFQFASSSNHSSSAPVSGDWYLIPYETGGDYYVIGWIVCSKIGNYDEIIFSRVEAAIISRIINANNIFSNKAILIACSLAECILINGAKRYSDEKLEQAIIRVRHADQHRSERYNIHAVNDMKQKHFMG